MHTFRRPLAMVLGLLVGIAAPHRAEAYVRSTTLDGSAPLEWTESACIYLRINSRGSDDISDGSDVAAARRAVATWQSVLDDCTFLRFEVLPDSPDAEHQLISGANENTIAWVEHGWPYAGGAAGITLVHYIASGPRKGKILDADIELNGALFRFSTAEGGESGKMDAQSIVTHELGHLLGLEHTCNEGSFWDLSTLPKDPPEGLRGHGLAERKPPVPFNDRGELIPDCEALSPTAPERQSTMYPYADAGDTSLRSLEADDARAMCEIYPRAADAPQRCEPVEITPREGGCCSAAVAGKPPPSTWLLLLLGGLWVLRRALLSRRASRGA